MKFIKQHKILSITLGLIIIIMSLIVLLYNTVWLQSFNNMKADDDTGTYKSNHMSYDNGTLTVKYYDGERYDIITPNSKTTVKLPVTSFSTYKFEDYILLPAFDYIQIFDMQGTELNRIKADSNIRGYFCENQNGLTVTYLTEIGDFYRYTLATNKTEHLISIDSHIDKYYFNDGYLYVEELVYDETTKAVFYKYDLNTSKSLEIHTIDFGKDITKGISVVREVSNQEIIYFDDYIFFVFKYKNYIYSDMYRYDKKDKKIEFVSKFNNQNFTANSKNIFYAVDDEYDLAAEGEGLGIWKINIDTLEKTLVTSLYFDTEFMCTNNYIYAYEDMDISEPNLPKIRRGYHIEQIPIS